MVAVKPGQIWKDNDHRPGFKPRYVLVVSVGHTTAVIRRVSKEGGELSYDARASYKSSGKKGAKYPHTTTFLSRFGKEARSGFTLIKDV